MVNGQSAKQKKRQDKIKRKIKQYQKKLEGYLNQMERGHGDFRKEIRCHRDGIDKMQEELDDHKEDR